MCLRMEPAGVHLFGFCRGRDSRVDPLPGEIFPISRDAATGGLGHAAPALAEPLLADCLNPLPGDRGSLPGDWEICPGIAAGVLGEPGGLMVRRAVPTKASNGGAQPAPQALPGAVDVALNRVYRQAQQRRRLLVRRVLEVTQGHRRALRWRQGCERGPHLGR